MKNNTKFYIFVGIVSFFLQLCDQVLNRYLFQSNFTGFVFISFLAWGSFALVEEEKKNIPYLFSNFILGLIFAVLMVILGNSSQFLGIFSIPLVALFVVPIMMWSENLPFNFNNVPIYFISAGAFFSLYSSNLNYNLLQTLGILILYILLGLVSGKISQEYFNKRKELY